MKRHFPVPRPTERAALVAADRSARPLPAAPYLFAGLVVAYACGDRHGANLCAHRIARRGGEVER